MILTSTSAAAAIPFTPPWWPDIAAKAPARYERTLAVLRKKLERDNDQAAFDVAEEEARKALDAAQILPVFRLRAAGVIERAQMEAELSGDHRAHLVQGFELKQAMRNGVSALLAGDPELDDLLALIDRQGEEDATFDETEERRLIEVQKALAQHWAEYRELVAQLERRRAIAPIVALRRFCVGWENARNPKGDIVPFVKGPDGMVAEAALGAIEPLDMMAAGNRAYSLQYAGADTEKNLPRPSPSDVAPKISASDAGSKGDGKSAKRRGRKTPV